jgi:lipid-A-disaccharide synthase
MNRQAPTIALVAGEASGDQLGAALIERLKARYPGANFVGIGGRKMRAAGMDCWWDVGELSVFGLFEVLSHFPRLLKLRRDLYRRLLAARPEVFIGIDAPDFNLGLEIKLRRQGLRTVHYVSPTVWAWRQRRVHKIRRAADRVLCLFPFEPAFLDQHGVSAVYVGHPMADRIQPDSNPAAARNSLGLDPRSRTVALLPGSRVSEAQCLAEPMIEAAKRLSEKQPGLQFVAAMAGERVRGVFQKTMAAQDFSEILLVDHDPLTVMAAADVVLCASGTATLETLLVNRPLVMTYRVAPASFALVKSLRLMKLDYFSLPNILAGEELIPELLQSDATGPRLAAEAERWLVDGSRRETLRQRFLELHEQLRCDAANRAAEAVSDLLENR